jgi:hypothetical protein
MPTRYAKRHYEDTARIIANANTHIPHKYAIHAFAKEFADLYANDNPRFDRDRFMRACGLEG